MLLERAFRTRLIDLSRVPDSLRSQRFDIVAKAAGKISGDQYWEMLQICWKTGSISHSTVRLKDAQVYALVLARKGRDPGPKLTRSNNARVSSEPGRRQLLRSAALDRGMMNGQRVPMARIARELSPFAGRPVQDETGLSGPSISN